LSLRTVIRFIRSNSVVTYLELTHFETKRKLLFYLLGFE